MTEKGEFDGIQADGTLYTGWTNDLDKRIQEHKTGRGGKYTRAHAPVELVYYESFDTKNEAMSREWHIKQLTRKQKLALIGRKDTDIEEKI